MGFLDRFKAKPTTTMKESPPKPGTVKDPVCGMWVDPKTTQHHAQHGAETYHFCSPGCKRSFEADPHKYLGAHSH
jgi:Cu+-exporting ATPase